MPASHPSGPLCCLAGVDTDLEESQEVVKFAKSLEIISPAEAGSLKVGRQRTCPCMPMHA